MTRGWQALGFLLVLAAAVVGAMIAVRLATQITLPDAGQLISAANTAVLGRPTLLAVSTASGLSSEPTLVAIPATAAPTKARTIATPEIPTPLPTLPEPTVIRSSPVPSPTTGSQPATQPAAATPPSTPDLTVPATAEQATSVTPDAGATVTAQATAPAPTPTSAATPIPVAPTPAFNYVLAAEVRNDNSCPGEYIRGTVRDGQGNPIANVRLWLRDQWGNEQRALSKSGATDLGQYDFPIAAVSNIYFLNVLDAASGRPDSPRVTVIHHDPNSPYSKANCHWVDWRKAQ